MSLKDQLTTDLREAMRAGDDTRKSTLRMLITAVRNAEIPPEREDASANDGPQRIDLDDEAVRDVVRKEVKQRRDSIDVYQKANRGDLAAKEEAEVAVLAGYLPQQMSRDEIEAAVRAVMERVGASGPADKGKVMPAVMAELRGRAEGREINAVVTELLAQ
ncbi:MAG TPA: GatB/YqeY domain-containing protein [Dehalococcoidia bacterium]|nr:GatB/YqeY domain-containing protein [Dehalococcoidia bacterium]